MSMRMRMRMWMWMWLWMWMCMRLLDVLCMRGKPAADERATLTGDQRWWIGGALLPRARERDRISVQFDWAGAESVRLTELEPSQCVSTGLDWTWDWAGVVRADDGAC